MNIICIIPARIGSTRLPRKPLLNIGGVPMVQRTFEAASRCSAFTKVIVATDSDEIARLICRIATTEAVEMTVGNYNTGSDRVAAVAERHADADVIVNLQADEPFIEPSMLEALVKPYLLGEHPDMTTLGYPLDSKNEYQNPNSVKVIYDQKGYALYFSRAPIPYRREKINYLPVLHHLGVYAFRSDFLRTYMHLDQTPLELSESLEQLRVLEHGYRIKICEISKGTLAIDTHEDIARAENILQEILSAE